jgi:hypothetical protein
MAGIRLFLLHSYRCYMYACHAVCMLLMFVRGGSGGMDVLTQEGQGGAVSLGCREVAGVCIQSK